MSFLFKLNPTATYCMGLETRIQTQSYAHSSSASSSSSTSSNPHIPPLAILEQALRLFECSNLQRTKY